MLRLPFLNKLNIYAKTLTLLQLAAAHLLRSIFLWLLQRKSSKKTYFSKDSWMWKYCDKSKLCNKHENEYGKLFWLFSAGNVEKKFVKFFEKTRLFIICLLNSAQTILNKFVFTRGRNKAWWYVVEHVDFGFYHLLLLHADLWRHT